MPDTEPDIARIVEVLDRHHVEYLLIGGVAALSHGSQRRTTDFDCLTKRGSDNFGRLSAAMKELGARIRAEGLSDEEAASLPARFDAEALGRMEISTWRTDAGDFDVLLNMPSRDGTRLWFEDLAPRAVEQSVGGVAVLVAALDDVIASKEWASRPKDHDALPELRQLAAKPAEAGPAPLSGPARGSGE